MKKLSHQFVDGDLVLLEGGTTVYGCKPHRPAFVLVDATLAIIVNGDIDYTVFINGELRQVFSFSMRRVPA